MRTPLVFLTALALAAPCVAQAHAMLESATPSVGSTVPAAPGAITLSFSEAVEPRFSKVVVTGPSGTQVDRADLHVAPDNPRRLILDLGPALGIGRYTVTWHAVSVDTHKTEGSYHFTVGEE